MTQVLMDLGIKKVAMSYVNDDYGRGLAGSFRAAFQAAGGRVTISAPHDDGKSDYSAEVRALAAAGGDRLVVAGYVEQGGSGIVRAALDSGAFDTFHLSDRMLGAKLEENFGAEIDGSTGQQPGSDSKGVAMYASLVGDAFDSTSAYTPEAYDAAALIMLAMQAAGSAESGDFKGSIMDVANAPGEKILPGELAKALQILADGGEIDYDGATGVELIGPGESAGNYRQIEVRGGEIWTVKYR